MSTPVEGGGTLLDSGFNSGTSGNNVGSPFTVTKSGAGSFCIYDNSNTGYAPASGLLSSLAMKLGNGSTSGSYAYTDETTSTGTPAEIRFWVYLDRTGGNRYFTDKTATGGTFTIKWNQYGTQIIWQKGSTSYSGIYTAEGGKVYTNADYVTIEAIPTGLTQYRIRLDYSAKTYDISRRTRLGAVWTLIGVSGSTTFPFIESGATQFGGSQILAGATRTNEVLWIDEIQYGTITDNDAQLRTVSLRQAVTRSATR